MIPTSPGLSFTPTPVPLAPILPTQSVFPPTTIPGAATPPIVSSPALRLPDAPPGATINADKPSVFNGATTAIVGSSISTAIPTASAPAPFSGSRTAVLGSNAITEAVNAAVSAANPPIVTRAPAPMPAPAPAPVPPPAAVLTPAARVFTPAAPVLPPSVAGTPIVKISEAETIGTPALLLPRTPTPAADIRGVDWDSDFGPTTKPRAAVAASAIAMPATSTLPPPAADDFAETPSSGSGSKTSPFKPSASASQSALDLASLPRKKTGTGTGKADVLAGWGWGTDSHAAIDAIGDDDSLDEDRRKTKKRMIIIFGAAGAAVLLVIGLAFAFSGGKKTEEPVAQKSVEPPPVTNPPKVDPPKTDPAPVGDPGVPKTDPDPAKVDPPKVDPPKVDPPKIDPKKPDPKKPDVLVKKDPPKIDPKKPDPKKPEVLVKKDPPKVDPKLTKPEDPYKPKVDAATSYRKGLQEFAKGDSTSALTSFKASLAADQGYAPTWRGIGMVYEKLGRTKQAATSFKKYLELSPGAPDAENIRARLERLGS